MVGELGEFINKIINSLLSDVDCIRSQYVIAVLNAENNLLAYS